MFAKAVNEQKAGLAKQLFPSSSPTSPQQSQTRQRQATFPLNNTSGNNPRPNGYQATNNARLQPPTTTVPRTLKRTSSGLAKFQTNDPFQESVYPRIGSQANHDVNKENFKPKSSTQPLTEVVYIDENDFDSEVDLDEEDPTGKGLISYPTLQSQPKEDATQPERCQSTVSLTSEDPCTKIETLANSGYRSQSGPKSATSPRLDHFRHFEYADVGRHHSKLPPAHDDTVRPAKRRTLPWLQEATKTSKAGQIPDSTTGTFTPLPKNKKGSAYPWNTTASAIKEQQKTFKQMNKNVIKSNEGNDTALRKSAKDRGRPTVAKLLLSHEQKHVLDLVVNQQKSIFFTGSAGTGKSVLLRQIIQELRKKFIREPDRLAVTASTGLAACNVGGVTLHSFGGIALGKDDVEETVKKIKKNQKAKHRWLRTKVLIIDEISMIDGDLFDKLEQVARRMRNNGRPFGGIQLVITGDFFQLPPVPEKGRMAKFAFDADTWNTTIEHTIGLHHVFRQKDPVFAEMLNQMRENRLSQKSINAFRSLSRELHFEDDVNATELFARRNEVDKANNTKMEQLVGEVMIFEARDGGTISNKEARDKLLKNCMAPETITLKKGAQVMLIKNMDDTLVNGSLGKVIGFMNEATWDNYQTDEDAFHSARGAMDDDLVGGWSFAERKSNKKVQEALNNGTQCWPVVRFSIADGTTRDMLCHRESWKVELPNGEVQASRSQVPLMLAWALSIHKAQGQTLERVKVDLGNVFENGQAYVALSRATSMDGLQVLRFDPRKVFAHDKVRNFYANLARVEAREEGTGTGEKGKPKKAGMSAADFEDEFVGRGFEDEEDAMRAYG